MYSIDTVEKLAVLLLEVSEILDLDCVQQPLLFCSRHASTAAGIGPYGRGWHFPAMVKVKFPANGGPAKVQLDGRPGLKVSDASAAQSVKASPRQPTAADEQRYPRASRILDSLSAYVSTTLASLVLLPLSVRKVGLQLPRGQPHGVALVDSFAGARATLGDSALRFGSSALLPPPLSNLVAYLGSIPLRGAVLRAQSGTFAAARSALPKLTSLRGFSAVWRATILRDIPFLCIETYALTAMVLGRARVKEAARIEKASAVVSRGGKRKKAARVEQQDEQRQAGPDEGRRGGIEPRDAVLAGTIAGIFTVPLDLFHTRMLVSGRPSAIRTSRAVFRLSKRRGPISLIRANRGPTLYIAECMAKPVAVLTIYTLCRALFVSSWLHYKMRSGDDDRIVVE